MKLVFLCWLACTFPSAYFKPEVKVMNHFGYRFIRCTNNGALTATRDWNGVHLLCR